jgi:hypothetical protein
MAGLFEIVRLWPQRSWLVREHEDGYYVINDTRLGNPGWCILVAVDNETGRILGYLVGYDFDNFAAGASAAPNQVAGSLIQPTDHARRTVETILRKSGYGATPLEKALGTFDQAPEDERIKLAPNLEIIKWKLQKVEHNLSGPLINAVLPLKIAFEFLACHLGTAIYNDVAQLAEIREVLRSGDDASDSFHVDRLSSDEYQPYHGLYFEGNDPHARVQIVLFGWLGFRVHLYRLAVGGHRLVYTQSNEEAIQVLGSEGCS